MLRIRCTLKNKNRRGLLLEPMTDDTAVKILYRKQPPKVPDKSVPDIAAAMVPRDNDGWMAIPVRYIFGTLKAGGRHVPFKGKANVTASDGSTHLYSFIDMIEEEATGYVRLYNGDFTSEPEWEPLVRVTRNDKGEAVVKVCPMIKDWRLCFTMVINDDVEGVSERMVRDIVEKAGSKAGLGAGRPQKGGGNGQFIIEEWEVLDSTDGAKGKVSKKKGTATA